MKKLLLSLGLLLPLSGFAQDNNELAKLYFSENTPELSSKDKLALNIAERFQQGDKTSKPFQSSDGSVSFVYGSSQIRVVCAPLQVCDIALQAGEEFNDMNVGDPRFIVEPSITGSGLNQQIHLLIKPKDAGLDTSLVVTTDRRTYHFRLKSDRYDFMPYVSFTYPDESKAKWQMLKRMQAERKKENTFVETIIEMPANMSQNEAPALLVLRGGGLFKKPESVMVNYRLQGCRYIVDNVFDKAMLVIGSGSSQEKITITRC